MRLICPPGQPARFYQSGGEVVSAESVVRILGNAPNRLLISASDGRRYILKLYEDHNRGRPLLRESMGTDLAASLGIPVPRWAPIYVSSDFIAAFAELWRDQLPLAGHYFGSEMLGQDPGDRVSDYLPGNWLRKVENRSDFIGALMLDLWSNNAQGRQAVFFKNANSENFQAVFIGFREMFSNRVDYSSSTKPGRYCRSDIYDEHWNEAVFSLWQRRILSLREVHLRSLFLEHPGEWIDRAYVDDVISRLLANQKMIRELQFRSFDPRSPSWNHPGSGLSISINPPSRRSFTRVAFGI